MRYLMENDQNTARVFNDFWMIVGQKKFGLEDKSGKK